MTTEELRSLGKRLNVKISHEKVYCVEEENGIFYYKDKVMNERAFKKWIDSLPGKIRIIMSKKDEE